LLLGFDPVQRHAPKNAALQSTLLVDPKVDARLGAQHGEDRCEPLLPEWLLDFLWRGHKWMPAEAYDLLGYAGGRRQNIHKPGRPFGGRLRGHGDPSGCL
jgi:hypothetical protein